LASFVVALGGTQEPIEWAGRKGAPIATLLEFSSNATLWGGLLDRMFERSTNRGLIMTFSSVSFTQRTAAREGIEDDEIRAFVAKHLDVDATQVTNEAHLRDDLGADWLNRMELLILIEDQFVGLENHGP
jgi:hypothetical protein